jgi:hypothetical protein
MKEIELYEMKLDLMSTMNQTNYKMNILEMTADKSREYQQGFVDALNLTKTKNQSFDDELAKLQTQK